jgi:hypothetical protein
MRFPLLVVLSLLLLAAPAHAGTIRIEQQGPNGEPIPGAATTARASAGPATTTTWTV